MALPVSPWLPLNTMLQGVFQRRGFAPISTPQVAAMLDAGIAASVEKAPSPEAVRAEFLSYLRTPAPTVQFPYAKLYYDRLVDRLRTPGAASFTLDDYWHRFRGDLHHHLDALETLAQHFERRAHLDRGREGVRSQLEAVETSAAPFQAYKRGMAGSTWPREVSLVTGVAAFLRNFLSSFPAMLHEDEKDEDAAVHFFKDVRSFQAELKRCFEFFAFIYEIAVKFGAIEGLPPIALQSDRPSIQPSHPIPLVELGLEFLRHAEGGLAFTWDPAERQLLTVEEGNGIYSWMRRAQPEAQQLRNDMGVGARLKFERDAMRTTVRIHIPQKIP